MSSPIGKSSKHVEFETPKVEIYADIAHTKGRTTKDTDVLVHAGINAKPGNVNKNQLTFKIASK